MHDSHYNADQRTLDGPRTRLYLTNLTEITHLMPDTNDDGLLLSREDPQLTELTKDNIHKHQRSKLSPRLTKDKVEAHAETTILCAFGPCVFIPNPTSGSVMPA